MLLDAREANNLDILKHAFEGMADKDARGLLAPVASRVELERRIDSMGPLLNQRYEQFSADLKRTADELKCETGVDLEKLFRPRTSP